MQSCGIFLRLLTVLCAVSCVVTALLAGSLVAGAASFSLLHYAVMPTTLHSFPLYFNVSDAHTVELAQQHLAATGAFQAQLFSAASDSAAKVAAAQALGTAWAAGAPTPAPGVAPDAVQALLASVRAEVADALRPLRQQAVQCPPGDSSQPPQPSTTAAAAAAPDERPDSTLPTSSPSESQVQAAQVDPDGTPVLLEARVQAAPASTEAGREIETPTQESSWVSWLLGSDQSGQGADWGSAQDTVQGGSTSSVGRGGGASPLGGGLHASSTLDMLQAATSQAQQAAALAQATAEALARRRRPTARVNLLTRRRTWALPGADTAGVDAQRLLVPGQGYTLQVELDVPVTRAVRDVGTFMLDVTLAGKGGVPPLGHCSQPLALPYYSDLAMAAREAVTLLPVLLGLVADTTTLAATCFESWVETVDTPLAHLTAHMSTPAVPVVAGRLVIQAQLTGLSYWLHHFFLLSAAVGVLGFSSVFFLAGLGAVGMALHTAGAWEPILHFVLPPDPTAGWAPAPAQPGPGGHRFRTPLAPAQGQRHGATHSPGATGGLAHSQTRLGPGTAHRASLAREQGPDVADGRGGVQPAPVSPRSPLSEGEPAVEKTG